MMNLQNLLFGRENRIGRRLIVLTIAFSSLLTLCISAVQLTLEYREMRSALDRELGGIAIYVPTISASVWDFDEKQIQRALDALTLLPHIVEARIVARDASRWSAGRSRTDNTLSRSYALRFETRGRETEIGTLVVVASLEGIYRQVLSIAAGIIVGNGLKTLLVAIFMVALFRRLITSRLESMAERVRTLAPQMLPIRQAVERPPQPMPAGLDELGTVGWTLDRTAEDLRIAVEDLNRFNAELEKRVEERTQELESFSYSISHDLRTPLRAINGFSRILIEDYEASLDDEGRRLLNVVRSNSERMGQLIDDMLHFSRTGRQALKVAPINMAQLARMAFAELQPAIGERNVRFELGTLPAALGDASLIRQVFSNLLGNAVKFTRTRSEARIEVSGSSAGGQSLFCVKDNGVGFEMEYAGKLFGVFERLHSGEAFEGTGIGLAIVKRIVMRHGGRVWAEGRVNEGTAVYFTLPHGDTEQAE